MGYFEDKTRLFQPDRIRLAFLAVGGSLFFVTELFRVKLRPVFRELEINDYGFTDSIGNSGGILVQIFLSLAIINPNRSQSFRLAAFFSLGYILYEIAQPYLPKGTFDWYDILATGVGYLISIPLINLLWKHFPPYEKST